MKKIIAIILLLAMFAFMISSCSNPNERGDENTGNGASEESPDQSENAENETTAEFQDRQTAESSLGEYDFGGVDFNVVLSTKQMQEPYFAEEQIGSAINDAVYKRNLEIEERFKVNLALKDTGGDWSEVAEAIKKSAMAGSGEYDLGLTHTFISLPGLISSGYLQDWNKISEVDMTKPWWNSNIKEKLSIDNKLFVASSDYVYQRPDVIYFNKQIIQDSALENPYALVKSGDWTWDKLAEMAGAVSADLNGDGAYDKSDRYGYAHWLNWQTVSIVHSNGLFFTENDGGGYPRYTPFLTEKMKTVVDKYYDLLYVGNKSYLIPQNELLPTIGSYTPLFESSQVLFLQSNTELLKKFTDLELDFGMIPLPKYDKLQQNYYCMANTQMMVIPTDAKNTEMSGVISEALSFYSYKYVVPAVYDVMYANRYLRDEESYEMFNLIMKGLVYEFSWTFGEANNMTYALPNLMTQKSKDITSYYDKNAPAAEKAISGFIDKVFDLE